MNSSNIYEIINLVIDNLRSEGELDLADTIKACVDGGSTGTEILMGVKWHLLQIPDKKLEHLSPALTDGITKLLKMIDDLGL